MDKRIKAVLQVEQAFRLFICVISIMYYKSHEPVGGFGYVFLGKSIEVYILVWTENMHLGRFRSGILQGRIKVAKEIFFPRIFSGKWKTGKCREFQESKTEWLRIRSSALC